MSSLAFHKIQFRLILLFAALAAMNLPLHAVGQQRGNNPGARPPSSPNVPASGPAPDLKPLPDVGGLSPRNVRIEGVDMLPPDAQPGRRPDSVTIHEAWKNEKGEQLVAVAGKRSMTQAELNARIALVLRNSPVPTQVDSFKMADFLEKKRLEIGDQILLDWAENATLAQESESHGYKTTAQEINDSLTKLAAPAPGQIASSQAAAPVQGIGISEDQVREEAKDALLIEKYINDIMKSRFTDDTYRKLYRENPKAFLLPPQVRAFHVFRALEPNMTDKQKKQIDSDIRELRKELRKRQPDYKELSSKSDPNEMLHIGDMGWTTADMNLPGPVLKALFSLEVGDTSEIIDVKSAGGGSGLHVFRILERKDGSRPTFEDARPQVVNYFFVKTKHAQYALLVDAYSKIQGGPEVKTDVHGLWRSREVSKEEYEEFIRVRQLEAASSGRPLPGARGSAAGGNAATSTRPTSQVPAAKTTPRPTPRPTPKSSAPPVPKVDLDLIRPDSETAPQPRRTTP